MPAPASPSRLGLDSPRRLVLAYFILFVGGASYGLLLALNRVVADHAIPTLPYIFWQSIGAAALLWLIALLRRKWPRFSGAHLRFYLLMGVVGHALPWTLLAYVAPRLPVGIVALGFATAPMWVYAMTILLKMERFRWLRVAGMALGFGGVLLIVLPETSLPEPGMVGWALLALLPIFCFALVIVASERWRPPEGDGLQHATGLVSIGTLAVIPVFLAGGEYWAFPSPFDLGQGAVMLAMGLVAWLWLMLFLIVRMAGPVFFSSVSYLDTLAGIGWGVLFFGEHHSPWVWAALGLLMAGLYCVNARLRGTGPPSA